jgi:site-specific recombinase XerD
MPTSDEHLRSASCDLDAGPLQSLVDGFVCELRAHGHAVLTIRGYDDSARHFASWLNHSGIELSQVDESIVQRFACHRCRCPGGRRQDRVSSRYVRRVRRFIQFLVERDVVSMRTPAVVVKIDARIVAFQDSLRRHRGISERTIERHSRMIVRLFSSLGTDPAAYDAALVRHAILTEARSGSRAYVKTMATALRGYLRFLVASGLCRSGLDRAVPTIPEWRLSALPRYLLPGDVQRVIESCDLTKPHGIRDHAILLLLARLGLRAGDILSMCIDDIAWNEGTLREEDRIFLRSRAPYRPFKDSSVVSGIVRLALRRAGIAAPPSRGANLLRHSAATGMLRAGASLDSISTMLRHRSLDITAHYAKVDIAMLQQVAQPWPGDVAC